MANPRADQPHAHIPADEWTRQQQIERLEKQLVDGVFRPLGKAS